MSDAELLAQALKQAHLAIPLSDPNPRVGCVLTNAAGEVIGRGHTQAVGGPHAEVMALRDAAQRGQATQGATAWVTLEPCSHHGRTGPCCDALIVAGVRKVVAAQGDPNPLVAGQGFAKLRAAGVEVESLPLYHPVAVDTRELNIGFFSRMERQRPWVRLKVAASLDGYTALPDGRSQWITSPDARADGHLWRARASCILTGIGTVLADAPTLDARLAPGFRAPQLAVVDSQFRTPLDAPHWAPQRQIRVYGQLPSDTDSAAHRRAHGLRERGAQVIDTPRSPDGRLDLAWVLRDLAARETNELHVEAGATLNGALLASGLVDELLLYMAPTLLAKGLSLAHWNPPSTLKEASQWDWHRIDRIGPDLRLTARVRK